MSKIKNLVFNNGERYPILIEENGIPDYWVTLYVTEKLRLTHTQSAILNAIGHLQHFRLWEEINNRDVVTDLSESVFLTSSDVHALRDHCYLSSKSIKKWRRGAKKKIVKFASASANRISHIALFLDFIGRIVLASKLTDHSILKAIDQMKSSLLASKPRAKGVKGLSCDPNLKSAPPEAFERLMEITREDSTENPFKNNNIRFRNAVIFDVMEATGMRAGELLALQIDDISNIFEDSNEPHISIVRRHDAIEDPRKKQPVAKTRERQIPVEKDLILRLRKYIMEVRVNIEPARKHPYIFVTHKRGRYYGSPISDSTFTNRILRTATAVNSELLHETWFSALF